MIILSYELSICAELTFISLQAADIIVSRAYITKWVVNDNEANTVSLKVNIKFPGSFPTSVALSVSSLHLMTQYS